MGSYKVGGGRRERQKGITMGSFEKKRGEDGKL